MKQSTSIRVKTNVRNEQLYKDLRPICGEAHSVFFFCVCLAIQAGAPNSHAVGRRSDRFWSGTITPDEWAVYYALAMRDTDMQFSVLEDDAHVLAIAVDYAEAGMDLLIEGLLGPYLMNGEDPALETRLTSELAWEMMKFIPDRLM